MVVAADVVESSWKEVGSFSPGAAQRESGRVQREQPHLATYVLASTESLSPGAHELGFYIFIVILRAFRSAHGKIRRITAGAVERTAEEIENTFSKLEGAHEAFLERAADVLGSREPYLFKYVVEALMEAPEDPDDPVELTEEERGTLFLVLATALEALRREQERAAG